MNTQIRRVGIGIVVLFAGLVAQLTYLQVVRADDLANDPRNARVFLRDLSRPRGPIVDADGAILAESRPSGDDLGYSRIYPAGSPAGTLFAHVVGYQSPVYGTTGTERVYNDELVGRDFGLATRDLPDLLVGRDTTGQVVLHLSRVGQQAARDALAGRRGSVVVLEPATGAVVTMYSEPTFDPNPLAGHDGAAVQAYQELLRADPLNPELARAWRERYPPGSTFKVVTTAIALDAGVATPDRVFPRLEELPLPLSNETLENFGGSECGGSLIESFRVSCNTTFGQIGLDLGEGLAESLTRFGINTDPPDSDVDPRIVRSTGPRPGTFQLEQPQFALAAIGQGLVAVTPLQMAMVAAAVADGGVMMVPHVAREIRDADGLEVVRRIRPDVYQRSMTPATADTLTRMMVDVVENGTGRQARIPGVQVAGKTGTAQAPNGPHAWFIGFAPAGAPRYAVAVLVEGGGDLGSEATGGAVAAPVAAAVLSALLGA